MKNPQNDNLTKEISDLNVKIPESVKRDVKALAAKEGKKLPQMVAELLALAVAQHQSQQAGAGR